MTRSAELLQAADPPAALKALTDEIKAKPADSKLRVFMAQLLCVLGQWERALNQLTVAAELDALAIPMKQVYGEAIRCEGLRAEVFAGKRTPMIFGQPDEWLALLLESLLRQGTGDAAVAEDLRARAFEAAPATPGTLDGKPFDWLADADMRIGPVLEAFVNGRYYWVPFERLAQIRFEEPEDLRDCVWLPAHLQFENGGETLALVPTRYPGSEQCEDGAPASRHAAHRRAEPSRTLPPTHQGRTDRPTGRGRRSRRTARCAPVSCCRSPRSSPSAS